MDDLKKYTGLYLLRKISLLLVIFSIFIIGSNNKVNANPIVDEPEEIIYNLQ